MVDQGTVLCYPTAAYLYTLHLDGPALAWEYLRRHPDYRRDWLRRRRRPNPAQRWGLRLLENPDLDARDAHPAWFPDHDGVLQLYADFDPPPDAAVFEFWRLPGRKQLIHDGHRLVLLVRWPGGGIRLVLAPDLADGKPYAYAVRAGGAACARCRVLAGELARLTAATDAMAASTARPRPSTSMLLDQHTLQALDATLAGASLREAAEVLFGAAAVVADWHADGALRARTRRLVRRGQTLMRGGYRRLAQLPPAEQGRSDLPSRRP